MKIVRGAKPSISFESEAEWKEFIRWLNDEYGAQEGPLASQIYELIDEANAGEIR